MKKRFLDLFPPPKFLEMRPVGLSFSERAIHAVELLPQGDSFVLGRFGTRPLPAGAIKEGYVNDRTAVTEALRSLQRELKMEFVSASLPEEKAYLFKTEVPRAAESDIRESVELRLEENVPLRAADAVFDFVVIPPSLTEGVSPTANLSVSVFVLPVKVVETYLEILRAAALRPVSLAVTAESQTRALIARGSLQTTLTVNIAPERTSLSIVSRGVVQFNLTVAVGGDAFTAALSRHFGVDAKTAERMKAGGGAETNPVELLSSLMAELSSIKDEIEKLFTYWETHANRLESSGKKIERVILSGRDASIEGLSEYLAAALKVPVEVGNVWQNAFSFDDHIPAIPFLDSLEYTSAVGLALPQ